MIFREPIKVELTFGKEETPKHYRNYFDGKDLPAELKVWKVHGELQAKDYGLVSDGYGFEDSPDCEFISGGVNSKGPRSMALGRQGNWFLWGFCAPPEEMTEQARKVFVNAVFWMEKFDGQKPLGQRSCSAREWALNMSRYLDDERLRKYGEKQFGEGLLKACGGDGGKLREMLEKEVEYLLGRGGKFVVDEDAKKVGIGNRDRKMLEWCVGMLEKGEGQEEDRQRAERLLGRYVDGAERLGDDAVKWRKWLGEYGERVYFSDTAGYRWFVRRR